MVNIRRYISIRINGNTKFLPDNLVQVTTWKKSVDIAPATLRNDQQNGDRAWGISSKAEDETR